MTIIKLTEEVRQKIKSQKLFKTINTRIRNLIELTAKNGAEIPYYIDNLGWITLCKSGSVAFDTDSNEKIFFNGLKWETV